MRVVFADCIFDGETRELFRGGRPVHLSPKAFRLLELLLESRPRALSKAEIHEKIWPDAFVSEATLASLVAEIREAIGEDARDARHIRTVHGFGYSFAGEAAEAPRLAEPAGGSSWRLIWEDRVIALTEGETVLGRDPGAGIRILSEGVSRRHARIVINGSAATLEDLGSKNGTFLRGTRIAGPSAVRHDDEIRLGGVKLTLRLVPDDKSTKTEIAEPPDNGAPRPSASDKKRAGPNPARSRPH
jgi:DNA-binding winged helix-turn-helix (wHTH) protein